MSKAPKRIAVLEGGWSPEREVSLVTGNACADGLREAGHDIVEIDVDRNIASVLKAERIDAAFNALHGQWGEDGCVQGLLEILEIPYSHSGVLASALAMDKERAKAVFRTIGIRCAESIVLPREEALKSHAMEPPYVVKPVAQGSSVGVHIVRKGDNRPPEPIKKDALNLSDLVMVEKFVPGRELTVAVMGEKALTVTEIEAASSFYDYDSKYKAGGSAHEFPANVPEVIFDEALEVALNAHNVLGCRGVTRTDFRYDDTERDPGDLYILEINTQPGMTPTSLVPEQAAHKGISFSELVDWMIGDASCQR
jgi:D-alanine-D-alanine ligase